MLLHPPEPYLVHELPPAPNFFGRQSELKDLRHYWRKGFHGVLSVVGLGGAGKTALVAEFLNELLDRRQRSTRAGGIFVWSFYKDPDAALFLQEALRYFSPDLSASNSARGLGMLHQLNEALGAGGPHLIVMDGLERVQQADEQGGADFGRLDDPLLKTFLLRVTSGSTQVMTLITSRFPITDLSAQRNKGFEVVELGGLDQESAIALLRGRGVNGDDEVLRPLVEQYGAHALTLDHLGGLVGQFLDGDPHRAPERSYLDWDGSDPQARKLGRLLRGYEQHLPRTELELLSKLCLMRGSVTKEQVVDLFSCGPVFSSHAIRDLVRAIMSCPVDSPKSEDELRRLARLIGEIIECAAFESPIAGPPATFRSEVLDACVPNIRRRALSPKTSELVELVGIYSNREMETANEERPLDEDDRVRFFLLCSTVAKSWQHATSLDQGPENQLVHALQDLGYLDLPFRRKDPNLDPASVQHTRRNVAKQLLWLVIKHLTLRDLWRIIRKHQQRFQSAGALARLDAGSLGKLLQSLVRRHLLLREVDGSFNVHPAVRDHFRRLAAGEGKWHEYIREHLTSLVGMPGVGYVEDRRTMDLVEEAIYHAIEAGQTREALSLYENVLGGHPHLAWKLGEMARGLRILRMFPECPDRWALAWYLRALGEMERAFDAHTLPYFKSEILLLQGRLPEAAGMDDHHRARVAEFLMGTTDRVPDVELRCCIPLGQMYLYLGRLNAACTSSDGEEFYGRYGWEGDRAKCLLIQAEVALRRGDQRRCQKQMNDATKWIVHSGSMEHLCHLHLVRSRFCIRSASNPNFARRAIDDGLHIAKQSGMQLHHIELLCERSHLSLTYGDLAVAGQSARKAYEMAKATDCQFCWGAAEAGHLLGHTLLTQGHSKEGREVLVETLALRRRIGHPKWEQTHNLLVRRN